MPSGPHQPRGKRYKHLEDGAHDRQRRCVDMTLMALTVTWVNLLQSVHPLADWLLSLHYTLCPSLMWFEYISRLLL